MGGNIVRDEPSNPNQISSGPRPISTHLQDSHSSSFRVLPSQADHESGLVRPAPSSSPFSSSCSTLIPSHARSRPHGTTATISTASSARCDFYKRPQWDRSELGSTQTRIRSSFSKASSDRPFCRSMRGRSTHDLQQRLQIGTRANSGLKQGSSGLRDPRRMGRCKSGGHVHLAARAAGDDQHLSAHISSPFAPFQLVAELH